MALLQIRLIIAKSCNKKLKYKLENLIKIQIFKNRLTNVGLFKLTIVSQLPKESYAEKNKQKNIT